MSDGNRPGRARRDIDAEKPAGSGETVRHVQSGTRPVGALDSVDTVLREYLSKPTAPAMEAVKIAVGGYAAMDPAGSGFPTTPPGEPARESVAPKSAPANPISEVREAYEDERPTGRFSVAPNPNPREHVRDRGVLVRLDGDASGEVLSLSKDTVQIGRSSRAQVHVTEGSVSREHARIVFEYGSFYLIDDASQNGTFVAGRRITRAELRDGDLIQVGQRVTYRFQLMDQTQERVMRRLFDSSMKDALTGADNRRHMEARLQGEIAFAHRHKRPLSIALLDIDYFKNVNDRYGHQAGDEVLKSVATVARGQLRTEDAFARYGGEEFVIVLRDTALPEATHVADRVRERVARTSISIGGVSVAVTISLGCASLSCCLGASTEELVSVADRRLYRAKRGGRNRVVSKDDG